MKLPRIISKYVIYLSLHHRNIIIGPQILKTAFFLKETEELSGEQQEIVNEYTSGRADEYMRIAADDPNLLSYIGLYDRLLNKINEKVKELY